MKILVVCLGNICRSPVAEGILLHLKEQYQLENLVIDSAGTSGYHINEAPDNRTIQNALKHGVNLKPLRARQFNPSDFDEFDLILGMDESNIKNIKSLSSLPAHHKKVKLFLDYLYPNENKIVPDPYYGTEKDFEEVFQLVWNGSKALLSGLGYSLK